MPARVHGGDKLEDARWPYGETGWPLSTFESKSSISKQRFFGALGDGTPLGQNMLPSNG
jgi:hypothetical protein